MKSKISLIFWFFVIFYKNSGLATYKTRLENGIYWIIPLNNEENVLSFNIRKKLNKKHKKNKFKNKHQVLKAISTKIYHKQSELSLINLGNSTFYIESINQKRLSLNLKSMKGIFLKKSITKNNTSIFKFIQANNNSYYICLNGTNLYLEYIKNEIIKLCSLKFSKILNISTEENIKRFQYKIKLLYKEYIPTNIPNPLIENAKIDVVFTYIDLSDPNLKRQRANRTKKDEEHDEFRYSLRSVLKFIPWVHKIYIIMPNEKVRFLKNINKIKEKIVYIKDKDFLGFDSASSTTFEFNLWRLKKFNASNNIIFMSDDYFIGKQLKKSDFFYEENGKILPIIHYKYDKVIKENMKDYINISEEEKKSHSHSALAYELSFKQVRLFLLKYFKGSFREIEFGHNALAMNLDDNKEIYDLIDSNYEHSNETLRAIYRNPYAFEYQQFYLNYCYNKYNRKYRVLNNKYFDVNNLPHKNLKRLNYSLFCLNTPLYSKIKNKKKAFKKLFRVMKKLFPKKSKYEKCKKNQNIRKSKIKNIKKKRKKIFYKNY